MVRVLVRVDKRRKEDGQLGAELVATLTNLKGTEEKRSPFYLETVNIYW